MTCVFFWDFTEHTMVTLYRRFGTTFWSHFQGSTTRLLDPWWWDWLVVPKCWYGITILCCVKSQIINIINTFLPNYTVSNPRRQKSSRCYVNDNLPWKGHRVMILWRCQLRLIGHAKNIKHIIPLLQYLHWHYGKNSPLDQLSPYLSRTVTLPPSEYFLTFPSSCLLTLFACMLVVIFTPTIFTTKHLAGWHKPKWDGEK
jgi:hypothetical protein